MVLENIVVDITQRNYNTIQTIQYDVDSRYVNVKIVSSGKNVDLTNYMVSIACKKPDGKIVFNETEIVEPKQGLIKFLISEQISSTLGEVVCELKIYGKNSSVLTTQYFTINVTQPIADKAIQSTNEFRQLTIAMNEYNTWISKVEDKYNGLEEEYAERLTEISTQLSKVATLSSFLSNPSTGFVAHRGSHILAPENTLKSIQLAGILGYEMIEIDVERTRDGVLILMHDNTVDRTTNGTGAVSNFTYDEIKKLKITEDYAGKDDNEIIRVPTLDEALAEARKHGLGVNLDCGKLTWTEEICHTAVGMLKKYGLYDISFFVMSNQSQRNLLTSLYPDVNVTWLSSDATSDWNIKEAKKYKNAFITYNVANITDKLLNEYISNGLAVFIYGCNTWENAYKYAKQGVRLIETDYILPKGVN